MLGMEYSNRPMGVHRYGSGGSMRACHAAGPGSIPGRDEFMGDVFSWFFLTCKKNVGKL